MRPCDAALLPVWPPSLASRFGLPDSLRPGSPAISILSPGLLLKPPALTKQFTHRASPRLNRL